MARWEFVVGHGYPAMKPKVAVLQPLMTGIDAGYVVC